MKAIVIGKKNGKAALLLEDGTCIYRKMDCNVGERVELKPTAIPIKKITAMATAAAALFAFVIGSNSMFLTKAQASTFVTLDVNPSVEFELDKSQQVVAVTNINESGVKLADDLSNNGVSGKNMSEAIVMTVELLEEDEILSSEEEGYMLLSVTGESDTFDVVTTDIESAISECDVSLSYSIVRTTDEERRAASDLNMSAARYHEMKLSMAEDEDEAKVAEVYRNKLVKEIVEEANARENDNTSVVDNTQNFETNSNTSQDSKNTSDTGSSNSSSTKKTNTSSSQASVPAASTQTESQTTSEGTSGTTAAENTQTTTTETTVSDTESTTSEGDITSNDADSSDSGEDTSGSDAISRGFEEETEEETEEQETITDTTSSDESVESDSEYDYAQ